MAISISAVIITYNEERNIERCLSSLKGVVDEIVVVDSFSKDRTEEICKLFNVRFIQNPFEGHIQQKNYAIDCASNDWIISLDADEALTDTLKKRNNARWQGVNPHDRLDMNNGEETGFLEGDLLHYSYYTREDHLKQIEYFGDIAARELYQRGGRSNYFKIVIKVVAQFFKSYFLKLGILDGSTGFTISRLSAYATYRKYVKLLNLQRGK